MGTGSHQERGPTATPAGPSVHDAYQLELDELVAAQGRAEMPAEAGSASGPAAAATTVDNASHTEANSELEEAHALLDAITSDHRDAALADRLRHFLLAAAGDRVARIVEPTVGKALARYHLERSGHPETCPCNPCRDARRLR